MIGLGSVKGNFYDSLNLRNVAINRSHFSIIFLISDVFLESYCAIIKQGDSMSRLENGKESANKQNRLISSWCSDTSKIASLEASLFLAFAVSLILGRNLFQDFRMLIEVVFG